MQLVDTSSGGNEESVVENAISPPPVLVRWTVKKPGATAPPTTNEYTAWTVEQLKKECTSR
ncbi:hypothetical protein PF004_g12550 [Phytophthora fragariae]|uniref:Uncharacterized protein n=1 Tax=Phytophthora fragariae TaxID=53985 RepID=A0A6G0NUS8_9STRA|nr:hypothetical protein PF004_g12550 [Phytophthora fragariae]